MKLRDGFVSNSSTTSFTCDVCGTSESWYDSIDGYDDYGFNRCVNGHEICDDDLLELPEGWTPTEEFVREAKGWGYEEDDEIVEARNRHCRPEEMCPICQFIVASDTDMGRYLEKTTDATREDAFAEVKAANKRRKKLYEVEFVAFGCNRAGKTREQVFEEIKARFGSYAEFAAFLRQK